MTGLEEEILAPVQRRVVEPERTRRARRSQALEWGERLGAQCQRRAGAVDDADVRRTEHLDVVIVDCLTTWVGNMLHHGREEATVLDDSDAAIAVIRARRLQAVVVSNEVGLGIVPVNELAREYRDVLGRVNQQWVAASDRAMFMVAGRAVVLNDPWDVL